MLMTRLSVGKRVVEGRDDMDSLKKNIDCWYMALHHKLNPMHVYCRLVGRGFNEKMSLCVTRYYERLFFRGLVASLTAASSFCSSTRRE